MLTLQSVKRYFATQSIPPVIIGQTLALPVQCSVSIVSCILYLDNGAEATRRRGSNLVANPPRRYFLSWRIHSTRSRESVKGQRDSWFSFIFSNARWWSAMSIFSSRRRSESGISEVPHLSIRNNLFRRVTDPNYSGAKGATRAIHSRRPTTRKFEWINIRIFGAPVKAGGSRAFDPASNWNLRCCGAFFTFRLSEIAFLMSKTQPEKKFNRTWFE